MFQKVADQKYRVQSWADFLGAGDHKGHGYRQSMAVDSLLAIDKRRSIKDKSGGNVRLIVNALAESTHEGRQVVIAPVVSTSVPNETEGGAAAAFNSVYFGTVLRRIEAASHTHHPGGEALVIVPDDIGDPADLIGSPGKVFFEQGGTFFTVAFLEWIEMNWKAGATLLNGPF